MERSLTSKSTPADKSVLTDPRNLATLCGNFFQSKNRMYMIEDNITTQNRGHGDIPRCNVDNDTEPYPHQAQHPCITLRTSTPRELEVHDTHMRTSHNVNHKRTDQRDDFSVMCKGQMHHDQPWNFRFIKHGDDRTHSTIQLRKP